MIWFRAWRELRMRLVVSLFIIATGILIQLLQIRHPVDQVQRTAHAIDDLARQAFLIGTALHPDPRPRTFPRKCPGGCTCNSLPS